MLQFASLVCKIHIFNPTLPLHFVNKGDKKAFSSLTKAPSLLKKKILQLKKAAYLWVNNLYTILFTQVTFVHCGTINFSLNFHR